MMVKTQSVLWLNKRKPFLTFFFLTGGFSCKEGLHLSSVVSGYCMPFKFDTNMHNKYEFLPPVEDGTEVR